MADQGVPIDLDGDGPIATTTPQPNGIDIDLEDEGDGGAQVPRAKGGVNAGLLQPHRPQTQTQQRQPYAQPPPMNFTSTGGAQPVPQQPVGTPISFAQEQPTNSAPASPYRPQTVVAPISNDGGVCIDFDDRAPPLQHTESIFAALVSRLQKEQTASIGDRTKYVGVFFYDGGEHKRPPDITASAQMMQSEDRRKWIVFVDDVAPSGGAQQCVAPLTDFDPVVAPFCHKAFWSNETDEAVELARALALQRCEHSTAFIVQYRQADGSVEATVLDSFALTNNFDSKENYVRKSSVGNDADETMLHDALSNAQRSNNQNRRRSKHNWMLWLMGVAAIVLIGALVAFFVIKYMRKRRQRDSDVHKTDAQQLQSPRTPSTVTFKQQQQLSPLPTPIAGTFL